MNMVRNGRAPPGLPVSPGPGDLRPIPDPGGTIARALARPLGAPALDRFVEPGDRVAVLQDTALPPELRTLAASRIAEALERAGASEVAWLEVSAGPSAAHDLHDTEARVPGDIAGPRHNLRDTEARVPGDVAGPGAHNLRGKEARGLADVRDTGEHRPGGTRADAFLAVGRAPGIGIVRLSADVVRADKLVLLGRAGGEPPSSAGGCAALVAWGSADDSTRRALLRSRAGQSPGALGSPTECWQRAVAAVLILAPPAFAVQLALQRDDRPTAVVAGDPEAITAPVARPELQAGSR